MKWHKMQDFPYEATEIIDPNKFVIISQRFYSNRSPYNCFVAQLYSMESTFSPLNLNSFPCF